MTNLFSNFYFNNDNTLLSSINSISLSFIDNKLERSFREQYFNKSLYPFRVSFITIILLYSIFGYLDLSINKELVDSFLKIRFLFVVPVLFIIYIISFTKLFRKIWQGLLAFSFIITGIGIIIMLLLNPNNIFYYGGMLLIYMAGFFFVKLRFLTATISAILLLLIYNLGILFFEHKYGIDFENLYVSNAFYLASIIISMIALYNIELLERNDFFQNKLLIEKQEVISESNRNLEEKVKLRTALLNEQNHKLIEEVSNRKKIEERLIKAKETAEENNRLKTAFLNNMSHEIRTPLNGIIGFLELFREPDLSEEEKSRYLDIINASSDRLIQTVMDIIDISKIEAEQVKVYLTDVSVNNILIESLDFFSNQANKKNIKLTSSPELSDKESVVMTDNQKLNGILTNLIRNAIKFTDKGSIDFGYKVKGRFLEFYVKDTGIGIPENCQETIFNRFEQVDNKDTRAYEGSGLGLSISKAYVEMLGGKIWLISEKGIGTEFKFTIPFK